MTPSAWEPLKLQIHSALSEVTCYLAAYVPKVGSLIKAVIFLGQRTSCALQLIPVDLARGQGPPPAKKPRLSSAALPLPPHAANASTQGAQVSFDQWSHGLWSDVAASDCLLSARSSSSLLLAQQVVEWTVVLDVLSTHLPGLLEEALRSQVDALLHKQSALQQLPFLNATTAELKQAVESLAATVLSSHKVLAVSPFVCKLTGCHSASGMSVISTYSKGSSTRQKDRNCSNCGPVR